MVVETAADRLEEVERLKGEVLESIEYKGTDIDWSTVSGGSWNSNKTGGGQQKTCVEINGKRFYRILLLPMEVHGIKKRLEGCKSLCGKLSAQDALRMVFLWDIKNYEG
jgi:hypothetical protein